MNILLTRIPLGAKATESPSLEFDDGVITSYVSEAQLSEEFTMQEIAEAYASTYDHNGNDDTYAVCEIEDVFDGEIHKFAFDGHGNFEWDTNRI